MKFTRRIAAVTGGVAMALGLAAVPAAAGEVTTAASCVGGYRIQPPAGWGKVTYSICYDGNQRKVTGTVTDLKTDGCLVRAKFTFARSGDDLVKSKDTGTSSSFAFGYYSATGVTADLKKIC
ncbi:hypothetical protein [Amycolatopsis sp. 195334CR]|uniref:hypothetical protein n=1 Tax=Amycolatopsis sp. 195334CR TaxID=2814588 RepID=UPI001A8CC72D|nr:hypothetical protein [Amycolatopsis sp. 195334CR]MBN6033653.1 hypothetical protein [Amycolatopsis sp. 195334CR]